MGLSPWPPVAVPIPLPVAIASSRLRASAFTHILPQPRQLFPPCRVLFLRSVRASVSLALFPGSGVSELPVGLWVLFFLFIPFLLKCQHAPSKHITWAGSQEPVHSHTPRQRRHGAGCPCPAKARGYRQCAMGYWSATGYRCATGYQSAMGC